jgi:hypothetical protein
VGQVATIDALAAAMAAQGPACATHMDAVMTYLNHHTKSLTVSNPSILSSCFALVTSIAKQADAPTFPYAAAASVTSAVACKMRSAPACFAGFVLCSCGLGGNPSVMLRNNSSNSRSEAGTKRNRASGCAVLRNGPGVRCDPSDCCRPGHQGEIQHRSTSIVKRRV